MDNQVWLRSASVCSQKSLDIDKSPWKEKNVNKQIKKRAESMKEKKRKRERGEKVFNKLTPEP